MSLDGQSLPDFLSATIRLGTPLILTAMGGVFSERSGVFNIGMEGMMLTGAFTAVAASALTGEPMVGVVAATAAGTLLAVVHAFFAVTLLADQIVVGVGLNLLALGGTNILYRWMLGSAGRERVAGLDELELPFLGDLPFAGQILFNENVAVYLAYALPPIATFVLYRTTWGLNVRAVGDNPRAAESAGIPVGRVRYATVLLSGAMAGLGGAALSLGASRFFTPNMTAGRGFIVLGTIVLGRWNPASVAVACLLFGAGDALQLRAQMFDVGIPHQFFIMVPYLLTIVAMIGFIGRSAPPEHLGKPFRSEEG